MMTSWADVCIAQYTQIFKTFADFGFTWPSIVKDMFNIAGLFSLNFKVSTGG
jgi:hypothetical protein